MIKYSKQVLLVSLIALTSACTQIDKKPSVAASAKELVSPEKVSVTTLWANQIGSGLNPTRRDNNLELSIMGKNLVSSDVKGKLRALDLTTGKLAVEKNLTKPVAVGPLAHNSNILYIATDGSVNYLDKNLQEIWVYETHSDILAKPGFDESAIYLHTLDGSVIAIGLNAGKKLWQYSHSLPSLIYRKSSSPLVTEQQVIVGLASGKLVALNKTSGNLEWQHDLSKSSKRESLYMHDVGIDPIISDNKVFAASIQGNLAAISLTTGRVMWEREIPCAAGLFALDSSIIAVATNGHVYRLNVEDGSNVWQQESLIGYNLSAPTIYKNNLVLGDARGNLHVLDLKDGAMLLHKKLMHKASIAPVVKNNQLFAYGTSGQLLALDIAPNKG